MLWHHHCLLFPSVSRNENPFKKSLSLMSCPRGASTRRQDKCIMTVSVYNLIDIYDLNAVFLGNDHESILRQFPPHQTSIPWTHYEDSAIMTDPSVLSTLPTFPISNLFNYNSIDESLLVMDSSSRPDSPVNFVSSSPEATLPGEPVIKNEDEMSNVSKTFDGIRSSSKLKRGTFAYPFSQLPAYPIYPDFKPYDFSGFPSLPWVQPTTFTRLLY